MTADPTAPATKQDVQMLMEHFVNMNLKVDAFREEIIRHFDVRTEHLIHEFVHGALADRVQQHNDRIVVLERRVFGG